MTKKDKIIEAYNQTKVVHPTYREIAKKTNSAPSWVFKVIQDYLKSKPKRGK